MFRRCAASCLRQPVTRNADLAPCLPAQILCCVCAVPIAPNAVNMCAQCLQTRYDIGEGISKQVQQNTCRGCVRYERRDGSFAPVEPESAELMALLLKKPRGLVPRAVRRGGRRRRRRARRPLLPRALPLLPPARAGRRGGLRLAVRR